jgi:hypothetical protein
MTQAVEILVPERSMTKVQQRLGTLPHVRFTSTPSRNPIARVLVALLADLEGDRPRFEAWLDDAWSRPATVPLVLLGPARGKTLTTGLVAFQMMALLSNRTKDGPPYVAPGREAVRRLVRAHGRGAADKLIASASLEDDTLYVWSCEPRLYRCPVKAIPALSGLTKKQLRNFEVSSSGSRLHWPDADVDINLDSIRAQVDPKVRKQAEAAFRQEAADYAESIKAVRKAYGLRQEDIPGVSERELRRLEKGEAFPHSKTVEKLAAAHGLSVADYLEELANHSTE